MLVSRLVIKIMRIISLKVARQAHDLVGRSCTCVKGESRDPQTFLVVLKFEGRLSRLGFSVSTPCESFFIPEDT